MSKLQRPMLKREKLAILKLSKVISPVTSLSPSIAALEAFDRVLSDTERGYDIPAFLVSSNYVVPLARQLELSVGSGNEESARRRLIINIFRVTFGSHVFDSAVVGPAAVSISTMLASVNPATLELDGLSLLNIIVSHVADSAHPTVLANLATFAAAVRTCSVPRPAVSESLLDEPKPIYQAFLEKCMTIAGRLCKHSTTALPFSGVAVYIPVLQDVIQRKVDRLALPKN